ncbi:PAS domain S-box protein [Lyngbya sp. PCC 8106]|uniref:PAS domain S-box protein n=1 Tax=Lyngbya sp. (strain PCC 8106) TaxID=313612 RepID=UPI0000EA89F2|nr:PAS domain S-box protein [Lyngbya sp. PCC 8106]EAW37288.1 two-component hybrid sensor and regulator [Lyngbya sp. PCC 8106]
MVIQPDPVPLCSRNWDNLAEILERHPLMVAPETPVLEALASMNYSQDPDSTQPSSSQNISVQREGSLSYALVMENNRLVGILTERDIVRLTAFRRTLSQASVGDVISPQVQVLHEAEYEGIFTVLSQFRIHQIRHLPVVNDQDQLLGVITPASLNQALQPANFLKLRFVGEVITSQVIDAPPTASVLEIVQLMVQHQVSCIVITETQTCAEDHKVIKIPVGMITERDIVQFQILGLNCDRLRAKEVMSTPLFSVKTSDSLWSANHQIQQQNIRQLVVTGEQGELLGLVTQSNLLHALNPVELYSIVEILEEKVSQLELEKQEFLKQQQISAELDQFFNQSVGLFCIAGSDGYFKRINPEFQSLLGYSKAELLSQPLSSFVHPEDQARTEAEFAPLTRGIPCRDFENRYRCRDGSYRWLSWTATPFKQGLLYAVARDITRYKQIEQQLQTSQKRYATLSEISPVGIFQGNAQREFVYVNQRWCEIAGLSAEEALGRGWIKAIYPEDLDHVFNECLKTDTQKRFQCEYRMQHTDGSIVWVYSEAVPEYNATGEIVGYVGTITDISEQQAALRERKQAELALQHLNQQLEERIERRTAQLQKTNQQLLQEVQEHRQTEAELQQSQHFIQSVADATPNILYIYDLIEQRNIYVNREIEIILGYTRQEIQNMDDRLFAMIIHPEDLTKFPEHHLKFDTANDNEIIEIEYRVRDINGNWHWLLSRDTIFARTPEGKPKQTLGAASDITERKKTEEQLRLSERAIAASNNGIVLADARLEDHPIIFVNPAFEKITGYSASEIIGENTRFLQGTDNNQPELERLRETLKNQESCTVILRNYRKDGSLFWNELNLSPIYDQQGNLTHYLGIQNDVTESKLAEEELRKQLERERVIKAVTQRIRESLELNEILNTTVTEVKQVLETDRALIYQLYADGTGKVIAEAVNSDWTAILDQTFPTETFPAEIYEDYLQGKVGIISNVDTENILPCLVEFVQQFQVKSKVTLGIIQKNKLWGLLIIHQCSSPRKWISKDIDLLKQLASQLGIAIQQSQLYKQLQTELQERQQAQQALLLSQERLQYLLSSSPGILYSIEARGDYNTTFVSENSFTVLGYNSSEILQPRFWFEHLHPDDISTISTIGLAPLFQQGYHSHEYRFLHGDGTYRWIYDQMKLVRDAAGQPLEIIGYWIDISDRKQAEEQLTKLSERLQVAIKAGNIGIWEWDLINNVLTWDKRMYELYGMKPSEFENVYEAWKKRVHSDDRDRADFAIQQALRGQKEYDIEFRVLRPDGSSCYLKADAIILRNQAGEPLRMTGINYDISDRKQAEIQLKATNEQLQAVLDAVPGFVSWVSSDLRYLGVNRQLARAMKLSPEDFIGQKIGFLDSYSSTFSQFFIQFFKDRNSYNRQRVLEVKVKNETRFYLLVAQKYNQDRAATLVGIDITEQKQVEEKLQATTSRLSTLIENLQLGVLVEDEHQQIVLANQTFCDVLELPLNPQTLTRHNFSNLTEDYQHLFSDQSQFIQRYQEIIDQGEIVTNEELQASDKRTFERDYVPIKIDQQSQGHLWIYRDISNRKQAELQLKNSLKEKEVLLKEIHHRVKNNLLVVANLLEFQSDYFEEPKFIQALEDSKNRVYSMALIHEKLYQSTNLSRINFGEYLEQLIDHLLESYGDIDQRVEFKTEVDPIFLNIETAHPCGLIVNELVSNVFKHAFPNGMTGQVWLKLHQSSEGLVTLTVQDNGIGFSDNIDFQNVDSLGMELICTLTTQLEGHIELIRGEGTTFNVTFLELQYQQRY